QMSHYRSIKPIPPGIPLEAKRYTIDELSSSESEDDFFSEDDREVYHSFSEESSEPSLPVRVYDHQYGSRDKKYADDRKRRPYCGNPMNRRPSHYQPPPLSSISSSTNDGDDESRTTNEDVFPPAPQYSAIIKPRRRGNQLGMIQELSPIQGCLSSTSPRGLVLPPPLSREMREWRPKHTSSVINAPVFTTLPPKTNYRHHQHPSPRATKNSLDLHPYVFPNEPRKDAFSDNSDSSLMGTISPIHRLYNSSPKRGRGSSSQPITSEKFSLPAPVAKVYGAKGIVFLRVEYSRELLTICVDRAEYFTEPDRKYRKNRTTYIQLEMIHRSRDRSESSRKRASSRTNSTSDQRYRTKIVENTDQPVFHKAFPFGLNDRNQWDSITISVIEKESNTEIIRRKLLGCFTFQIKKIRQKAKEKGWFEDYENNYSVEVINDGYFILDPSRGQTKTFPMSKIVCSKSYLLDGPSSTSSSSLNVHSPQKMLRSSDWPLVSSHLPSRSSSAITPLSNTDNRGRPRPVSYMEGLRFREGMAPTMESFGNSTASTGSSSIDYDFHRHRMTLPSITTTSSSMTSDEGPSCSSSPFNPSLLHPAGGGEKEKSEEDKDKKPIRHEGGVRRAASFTYSPNGSAGKHNRRPEGVVGKDEDTSKKKLFGPLTKTFSYIRSKMDSAISTSSLYPSKEDVRQWENSFESLLNHKYGQMLFSQFLKKEYCSENLEFWMECEEFKKMKDGKKSTKEKAVEIFEKYVSEHSQKEVNLDSDTRMATKAAMESGSRTDTFNLAQTKIQTLMADDKYRRFLKDRLYLDMLHSVDGKSEETTENGAATK
ncbi:hypothetical protein PENTCL1PPCAC_26178, partial [Pristionchus entomophagus]